jgi:hypothetical protein
LLGAPAAPRAQDAGADEVDEAETDPVTATELREAMRLHFRNGLRAELALSDEQMERVMPRLEAIEEQRHRARQARLRTVQELRRGLRQGASDAELRELLERLDRVESDEQELERTMRAEIDAVLTVRQSVQFRFFAQDFRREMHQRIRHLRDEGEGRPFRGRRMPRERDP